MSEPLTLREILKAYLKTMGVADAYKILKHEMEAGCCENIREAEEIPEHAAIPAHVIRRWLRDTVTGWRDLGELDDDEVFYAVEDLLDVTGHLDIPDSFLRDWYEKEADRMGERTDPVREDLDRAGILLEEILALENLPDEIFSQFRDTASKLESFLRPEVKE